MSLPSPDSFAVILARGGSKGLLRKNLKRVGGLTLVARAVRASVSSGVFDGVVVSSDDNEILAEAMSTGAQVIRRPSELSSDVASSEAGVLHAIDWLLSRDSLASTDPIITLVQPSSPFIDGSDLMSAVRAVREASAESAFAATTFHGFVWRRDGHSWIEKGFSRSSRPRRQDLADQVIETGAFYSARASTWRHRGRFGATVTPIIVPTARSLEIDDESDLWLAEAISRHRTDDLSDVSEQAAPRLLVVDFDGVLTDDRVHMDDRGHEFVSVSRRDGASIAHLKQLGVRVLVITREASGPASARAKKLGVELISGATNKGVALSGFQENHGFLPAETWVVGNTVHDLPMTAYCGISFAPRDAQDAFRAHVNHVLSRNGGEHLIELIAERIEQLRAED